MQQAASTAASARKQGRTANIGTAAIAAKSAKLLNRYCPVAAAILAPWAFIECAAGDLSPAMMVAAVAVTVAPLYLTSKK